MNKIIQIALVLLAIYLIANNPFAIQYGTIGSFTKTQDGITTGGSFTLTRQIRAEGGVVYPIGSGWMSALDEYKSITPAYELVSCKIEGRTFDGCKVGVQQSIYPNDNPNLFVYVPEDTAANSLNDGKLIEWTYSRSNKPFANSNDEQLVFSTPPSSTKTGIDSLAASLGSFLAAGLSGIADFINGLIIKIKGVFI